MNIDYIRNELEKHTNALSVVASSDQKFEVWNDDGEKVFEIMDCLFCSLREGCIVGVVGPVAREGCLSIIFDHFLAQVPGDLFQKLGDDYVVVSGFQFLKNS